MKTAPALLLDALVLIVHAKDVLVVTRVLLQKSNCMTMTQQLWETYAHDLQKYIASRVDGPAADDILQQVFLKVHAKSSQLRDPQAQKQRIYRITQHSIIDRYRAERGGQIAHMDDVFWESMEDDTDTDRMVIARNISSCLLPMIDDLGDVEKSIMKQYLDGVSHKDIAQTNGQSLANVKVIIHRTKKLLQKKYTQCCYQYRDEAGVLIDTWCSKNCGCENSVLR